MTTRRARGAAARSGGGVLAGALGICLLLTAAACTSSDSASASASASSSAAVSTTPTGSGEASQMTDASQSYAGGSPTVS
jgi:hypothetical protein